MRKSKFVTLAEYEAQLGSFNRGERENHHIPEECQEATFQEWVERKDPLQTHPEKEQQGNKRKDTVKGGTGRRETADCEQSWAMKTDQRFGNYEAMCQKLLGQDAPSQNVSSHHFQNNHENRSNRSFKKKVYHMQQMKN